MWESMCHVTHEQFLLCNLFLGIAVLRWWPQEHVKHLFPFRIFFSSSDFSEGFCLSLWSSLTLDSFCYVTILLSGFHSSSFEGFRVKVSKVSFFSVCPMWCACLCRALKAAVTSTLGFFFLFSTDTRKQSQTLPAKPESQNHLKGANNDMDKNKKKKIRAFESFENNVRTPPFALVTKMDGDTSGVSSWPESSVFVATHSRSGRLPRAVRPFV